MRPNQVWAMDITYIPMAKGFVYLAAVLDWFWQLVLAWRDLLQRSGQSVHGRGLSVLIKNDIAISMEGRGAWRDNVFVERLWRNVT